MIAVSSVSGRSRPPLPGRVISGQGRRTVDILPPVPTAGKWIGGIGWRAICQNCEIGCGTLWQMSFFVAISHEAPPGVEAPAQARAAADRPASPSGTLLLQFGQLAAAAGRTDNEIGLETEGNQQWQTSP